MFKRITRGSLIAATLLVPLCTLAACSPESSAPLHQTAQRSDLSGEWEGGSGDWGTVVLKAAPEGYVGTYSSVFTPARGLGTISLGSGRDGRLEGFWRDSDGVHYGTLQLGRVDANGIQVTWQARDARAPMEQRSLWHR